MIYRFLFSLSVIVLSGFLWSCDKKIDEQKESSDINSASKEELAEAVADRDMLIELMSEINSDMEQIKKLEGIMTSPSMKETPDKQEQIRADIRVLSEELKSRREKLEQLEQKLQGAKFANDKLKGVITNLKSQINSKEKEISTLRASLNKAQDKIDNLGSKIDSLNVVVTETEMSRQQIEAQNENLTTELNTCYYVIGSSKELKEHKIIESSFLRKTKLMKGEFDQNFFTEADKRTLTLLDLNSKKAQVLTNQPTDSYILEERGGRKVLRIVDPVKFWSLSNYLVVKID